MKKSKLLGIINFFIIFLVFFIADQFIKVKNNLVKGAVIGLMIGILLYLYPKLLDKKCNL
ncbi:hypothetical protein NRP93_001506 [Clostridium botulinum]|nr:hypothetical protein [Clostridium botulinum]